MGKYFEQMSDAVVQVRNALAGWETYEGTVLTNVRLQRALQSGWKGLDEAKKVVVIKELERMPEWLKKDGRRIEDFEDFTDGLPLNRRLRSLPFPEIRRMIQNYRREQVSSDFVLAVLMANQSLFGRRLHVPERGLRTNHTPGLAHP